MGLSAVALLLALAGEPPAPAAPSVQWQGPDACTDAVFQEALQGYLRRARAGTELESVAVEVASGEAWTVEISLRGAEGETRRSLRGDGCEDVSEAAALVVALAIDPEVGRAEDDPRQEDAFVPPPDPAVADDVDDPVAPASPEPRPPAATRPDLAGADLQREALPPAREPSTRVVVRALGGVDGLALPGAGGIVGGALGVRVRRAWVGVTGAYRFPTFVGSGAEPGVGADLSRWTVGARTCFAPTVATVHFPLCAGLEAGQTVGRGRNLMPDRVSRLPWVAPRVDAGVLWALHPRVGLGLEAGLAVPVLRTTFVIDGLGTLHEVGRVSLSGLLALEIRLR